MTPLAGVHDDLAQSRHERKFSNSEKANPVKPHFDRGKLERLPDSGLVEIDSKNVATWNPYLCFVSEVGLGSADFSPESD